MYISENDVLSEEGINDFSDVFEDEVAKMTFSFKFPKPKVGSKEESNHRTESEDLKKKTRKKKRKR